MNELFRLANSDNYQMIRSLYLNVLSNQAATLIKDSKQRAACSEFFNLLETIDQDKKSVLDDVANAMHAEAVEAGFVLGFLCAAKLFSEVSYEQ